MLIPPSHPHPVSPPHSPLSARVLHARGTSESRRYGLILCGGGQLLLSAAVLRQHGSELLRPQSQPRRHLLTRHHETSIRVVASQPAWK